MIWLALASLVFYSVSNWQFVLLLLASVAFNYLIGLVLISKRPRSASRVAALTIGVAGDLLTLGYFKYAGFLAANFNWVFSTGFTINVLLPVGISFYTFTQIAFLVDAYRGNVARYALPHYALFVTYFPHLIAGPILHHRDMIPQFERAAARRPDPHLILCGLIIFGIGLFKKTCLADGIQPLVSLAFGPNAPTFDQAWIGALAYTFQLSFGFLRLFRHGDRNLADVRHFPAAQFQLPLQGHQHYRFLAALAHDAVPVPARLSLYSAGRQPARPDLALCQPDDHDAARRLVAWRSLDICGVGRTARRVSLHQSRLEQLWSRGCAALCAHGESCRVHSDVLVGRRRMGVFRADSLSSALYVLSKMTDPTQIAFGRAEMAYALFIIGYAALGWFAPNTQTIMGHDHKNRTVGQRLGAWQKRPAFLYATAAVLAFGILGIQQHSEFIYFRF